MPPSPLSEAPHYNGNTLSPASPRPIHIPEPHNIPVLQNQIDPVFNLVATHMEGATNVPNPAQSAHVADPSDGSLQDSSAATISQFLQANPQDGEYGNEGIRNIDRLEEQADQNTSSSTTKPNQPPSSGNSDCAPTFAQSNMMSFTRNQTASSPKQNASEAPSSSPESPKFQQNTTTTGSLEPNLNAATSPNKDLTVDTGNIQALLDNLIASASSAAQPRNDTVSTAAPTATTAPQTSSPSSTQTPISALPTPAGLPPRPPPQDEPAIHPNYTPGQSIRSYHNPPPPATASNPSTQSHSSYRPSPNYAPSNSTASNGMPPPPSATFQQSALSQKSNSPQEPQQRDEFGRNVVRPDPPLQGDESQSQTGSDLERAYEDFLRDEAAYVAEGAWDRFPQGSRLFVGNLFTEKVSKRHIFDIFSKYGRLAQISMKNAYGFVQFIDPGCSTRAMQAEEGTELGGRKIHLEISKPQKNTRNTAASGSGDGMRGGHSRRSRSPDYSRNASMRQAMQRQGPNYFERGMQNNFDRRGRDDYRPVRSPSPRGVRGYDNYVPRNGGLDRYYGGRRSRSRSPYGRNGRYKSRSPRGRDPEDEASLPIPRRNPVQVPDVQIIIVDESDRTFVGYIQQSFRDRGLRCDVLQLPRGVSLQAVVRRQIIEGVQAVVKIHRRSQVTGKIPLQIFDRSGGTDNVRFDQYEELDAGIAADVVVRSKNPHIIPSPATQQSSQQYGQNPGYNQIQSPYGQQSQQIQSQQMPPHQVSTQQPQIPNPNSNLTNAISALDGPALQKLLASFNQNHPSSQTQQQQPQGTSQQQPQLPQDLASLLSSVARQAPQQQSPGYQQPPTPSQGYPYQAPPQQQPQQYPQQNQAGSNSAYANNQALSQLLSRAAAAPLQPGVPGSQTAGVQGAYQGIQSPHQQQPTQQQNVQDIMAQLAKYRG